MLMNVDDVHNNPVADDHFSSLHMLHLSVRGTQAYYHSRRLWYNTYDTLIMIIIIIIEG